MNADDRMGDDLPDWAIALMSKYGPVTAMPFSFDNGPGGDDQWCVCTKDSNLTGCDMDKEDAELFALVLNRARELSAHGGDGGGVDVSDIPFDTVRKVVSALTWLGHSTPESQEEQAARSVELVNTLCREVLALATQQPASGDSMVRQYRPIRGDGKWTDVTPGGFNAEYNQLVWEVRTLYTHTQPPAPAAHGGSGEVRQFKLRTVKKWTGCPDAIFDLVKDDPDFEVRTLVEVTTPPTSASDAEVGAVSPLPEPALTEQAEYLSDKYISYFTIDQMHAYAKSYLTRSPAPDAEKIGPELAAAIEFLARPRVGRSSVISILENLTNECIRMKSRATRSPARVGGVTDALDDYRSHHRDFRDACVRASAMAESADDASYWQHQIDHLDKITAALTQQASP